jgi:hypothetical protein
MGDVQYVAGVLPARTEVARVAGVVQDRVHDPFRMGDGYPELGEGTPREPVVAVHHLEAA